MDIKEELVSALFNKDVRENASKMFQINFNYNGFIDRMPLDLFDISFRLYKPTANYVNLEFLASSPIGNTFSQSDFMKKISLFGY